MLRLIGLDSGPLGLLTHPKPALDKQGQPTPPMLCFAWLQEVLRSEVVVALPSIAHYELRREYLLRANTVSLQKLDALREVVEFLPMDDAVLEEAALLWAKVRASGRPTADPKALDIDCLVATQVRLFARSLGLGEDEWIVATTDVGDLPRLAPAATWNAISS